MKTALSYSLFHRVSDSNNSQKKNKRFVTIGEDNMMFACPPPLAPPQTLFTHLQSGFSSCCFPLFLVNCLYSATTPPYLWERAVLPISGQLVFLNHTCHPVFTNNIFSVGMIKNIAIVSVVFCAFVSTQRAPSTEVIDVRRPKMFWNIISIIT